MLFAVWWCPGRPPPQPLCAHVSALLERPGAARVDGASSALVAWLPSCLEREGQAATVFAAPSGASGPARGYYPSVRLEQDTLTIAAGPLPQYPLYYARAASGQHLL